jgi:hypothetical protein
MRIKRIIKKIKRRIIIKKVNRGRRKIIKVKRIIR